MSIAAIWSDAMTMFTAANSPMAARSDQRSAPSTNGGHRSRRGQTGHVSAGVRHIVHASASSHTGMSGKTISSQG